MLRKVLMQLSRTRVWRVAIRFAYVLHPNESGVLAQTLPARALALHIVNTCLRAILPDAAQDPTLKV